MSEGKDFQLSQVEDRSASCSQNVDVEESEPVQSAEASAVHRRLL